jgi:hypothetical protein
MMMHCHGSGVVYVRTVNVLDVPPPRERLPSLLDVSAEGAATDARSSQTEVQPGVFTSLCVGVRAAAAFSRLEPFLRLRGSPANPYLLLQS